MQEALKTYLAMATGLTEVSKKRAKAVAKKLAKSGGATVEQMQNLTEELLSTSLANREAMVRLVRYEIDRALGRIGLATAEEVEQLNARVRQLEHQVRAAERASAAPTERPAVPKVAAKAAPTRTAPAKTTAAKAAPRKVVRKAAAPAKAVRKATTAKSAARKATTRPTGARANGSGPTPGAAT